MTLLRSPSTLLASDLDSQKESDGREGGGKLVLGCVSRVTLLSKLKRYALHVDIIPQTAPGYLLGLKYLAASSFVSGY